MKLLELAYALYYVPVVIWKRVTCKHSLWGYRPQEDCTILSFCFHCGYSVVITCEEFAKVVLGE